MLLNATGTGTPNLYLYTGEQWDADLGMYFLRARYMDPETGRFHTMDTFEGVRTNPQSLHKYLYAHANPIVFIDPTGQFTLMQVTIAATVVGVISGTLVSTIRGSGLEIGSYSEHFYSCVMRNGGGVAIVILSLALGVELGGAPLPKVKGESALGAGKNSTTRLSRLNMRIAEILTKGKDSQTSKWVRSKVLARIVFLFSKGKANSMTKFKSLRFAGYILRNARPFSLPIAGLVGGYSGGMILGCAIDAGRKTDD